MKVNLVVILDNVMNDVSWELRWWVVVTFAMQVSVVATRFSVSIGIY